MKYRGALWRVLPPMGFCHQPVNVHVNSLFLGFVLWPALSIYLEKKISPSQMQLREAVSPPSLPFFRGCYLSFPFYLLVLLASVF